MNEIETETATAMEMEDETCVYGAVFFYRFGEREPTHLPLGQGSFAECHALIRKCYNDTPAPPGAAWYIVKFDPDKSAESRPQHHETGSCSACGRRL
jgi:hypothetical protein